MKEVQSENNGFVVYEGRLVKFILKYGDEPFFTDGLSLKEEFSELVKLSPAAVANVVDDAEARNERKLAQVRIFVRLMGLNGLAGKFGLNFVKLPKDRTGMLENMANAFYEAVCRIESAWTISAEA